MQTDHFMGIPPRPRFHWPPYGREISLAAKNTRVQMLNTLLRFSTICTIMEIKKAVKYQFNTRSHANYHVFL